MAVPDRIREYARTAWRWSRERPPISYLVAGWVVFVLGAYPGYMSLDSTLQLYQVRTGLYTDTYPPVMTGLWALLEYVVSGPFPMLLLQSGLFLFGLAAVLRTVLTPRAAAITAAGVLLFPPVFAPMAVIWPDPLVAGCLLAGAGALLDPRRGWKLAGLGFLALACACRPEIVLATVPILLLAVPPGAWWRRIGLALAVMIGVSCVARIAEWALTDTKTYEWHQRLMLTDTVSTIRRLHLKSPASQLPKAFEGLLMPAPDDLPNRMSTTHDALDWYALAHGDKRLFDPVASDESAAALSRAWRRTVLGHPLQYLMHRELVLKYQLGIGGKFEPIYDSTGDVELLAPLHHRAIHSRWQNGTRSIVRAATPLFRPWLYLLVAIAVLVIERRRRSVARTLAASGLVYLATLAFLAPVVEYRLMHWLVASAFAAGVALLVARRPAWRAQMPVR